MSIDKMVEIVWGVDFKYHKTFSVVADSTCEDKSFCRLSISVTSVSELKKCVKVKK